MSVRRISSPKYVHLMYDMEYAHNEESRKHLSDLRAPLEQLGYKVREYFVDPDNVQSETEHIPRDDRSHIIFLHVDMPQNVAIGTPIYAVRYIEQTFKYVVGFDSAYSENCVWKSVMNRLFDQHAVPRVPSVKVDSLQQLESSQVKAKIAKLKKPYFMKVDSGYNSLGLSDSCVTRDIDSLMAKAREMISSYGSILIQPFISGREYTVAVTDQQAYYPVERVFADGQLVSQPGGTATEKLIDPSEVERIETIQKLAFNAYRAVGGSGAYGRVDLREDPETGEIFVLEVNNTCSMAPKSYFEISVEACGSSKKKVIRDIMKHADSIQQQT